MIFFLIFYINEIAGAEYFKWVSEFVCVCVSVWMFPNSSEMTNPSNLKFWGMSPLGIGKVLG